jgi:hypothetical protein
MKSVIRLAVFALVLVADALVIVFLVSAIRAFV